MSVEYRSAFEKEILFHNNIDIAYALNYNKNALNKTMQRIMTKREGAGKLRLGSAKK